jgi:hypothetical protein
MPQSSDFAMGVKLSSQTVAELKTLSNHPKSLRKGRVKREQEFRGWTEDD